jgi:hypothetical protein
MKTLRAAVLMCMALALAVWAQGIIRLKTRTVSPVPASEPARREAPPGPARHFLLLFASYPGADVREVLARRHIVVLAYVPDNALMVSAEALRLTGLNVTWSGPLDPSDKLSPALAVQPTGAYLVVFHPDTSDSAARQALEQQGYTIVSNPHLLPAQWLVTGAASGLEALAACDAVAYILPASADLQSAAPVLACPGALSEAGPVAEYAQAVAGWSKDAAGSVALHYFFDSLTDKLDPGISRAEVARALAEWARYANVTFADAGQPQPSRGIDFLFASRSHGDPYPFDGPGGVLAHTFYPPPLNPEPLAGDVHFDADENWHVGASVDLFTVALHETGHALGLAHSDKPDDVMYPYYHMSTGLSPGDVTAVQALYGPNPGTGGGGGSGGGTGTGTGGGTGSGTGGGTGSGGGAKTGADTTPPSLSILSPSSTIVSTTAASISLTGTATDNVGVTAVKWSTSSGDTGQASGTTTWTAAVSLLVGTNVVTVRAYDAAGNSAWRAVTVVRH